MEFFEHFIGYRFTPDSYFMAALSFLMGLVSIAAFRWIANRKPRPSDQSRDNATIVRHNDTLAGGKGVQVISVFFLVIWPLFVFVFMGESIETPAMENG